MPLDNLNPEISYRTYLNYICSIRGKRHINQHNSVGGSKGTFAESYFLHYFTSVKKLNKALRLHITIVIKETFLTIQSRCEAI